MENNLVWSHIIPANPLLDVYLVGVYSVMNRSIYNSPGYEIKKKKKNLKTTQLSLGQKMNNQVMLYSYNAILSSSNSMHEF